MNKAPSDIAYILDDSGDIERYRCSDHSMNKLLEL